MCECRPTLLLAVEQFFLECGAANLVRYGRSTACRCSFFLYVDGGYLGARPLACHGSEQTGNEERSVRRAVVFEVEARWFGSEVGTANQRRRFRPPQRGLGLEDAQKSPFAEDRQALMDVLPGSPGSPQLLRTR